MTTILPRPAAPLAVSEVDQLRTENTNLRAMVTALLDELVHHDVTAASNYAEHPRSVADLAIIAARSHNRYARLALNAIPAKEQ
jgi:hypothetical protein